MKRVRLVSRLSCVVCIAAFVFQGCDEGQQPADGSEPAPGPAEVDPLREVRVTAECGSGWFETESEPGRGIRVGRLAVDGEVLGYSVRDRYGDFISKAPLAIEGKDSDPVTVRVRRPDAGEVGLVYGRLDARTPLAHAADSITLIPCGKRPRTSFIGGLVLDRARARVKLEVVLGDHEQRTLEIPRAPGPVPELSLDD